VCLFVYDTNLIFFELLMYEMRGRGEGRGGKRRNTVNLREKSLSIMFKMKFLLNDILCGRKRRFKLENSFDTINNNNNSVMYDERKRWWHN
jgi:hypothetical protein